MSNAPVQGGDAGLRPRDRLATLVICALVIAVAVAAIVTAQDFPATMLATDVGPARFPIVYAAALIVLCGILAIQTLRKPIDDSAVAPATSLSHGTVAIGMAASVACLIMMTYVGFALATLPFVAGVMWLMGQRSPIWNPVLAMVITGLIHVTFSTALGVPLPVGSLFE
jgi:hypothetical protein